MNHKKTLLLELGWSEEMIEQFILDSSDDESSYDVEYDKITEGTELSINYDYINATTKCSLQNK